MYCALKKKRKYLYKMDVEKYFGKVPHEVDHTLLPVKELVPFVNKTGLCFLTL